MGVLLIGDNEKHELAQALARARAKPMPWSESEKFARTGRPSKPLGLEDMPDAEGMRKLRERYPSQRVLLGTYRVAISIEETPTGMLKHMSVSAHSPGFIPQEVIVSMVAAEFEFSEWPPSPKRGGMVWLEEFAPDHFAVNATELDKKEKSDAKE